MPGLELEQAPERGALLHTEMAGYDVGMDAETENRLAPLFANLSDQGRGAWCDQLKASAIPILDPSLNGHVPKWRDAIASLPDMEVARTEFENDAVTFDGSCSDEQRNAIHAALQVFHPWRKGPFEVFGIHVDAEWRSDLKWQRLAPHVELRGQRVLDVGCGNGYYGWRMMGAGARQVVGLEPYPLYSVQHSIFKRYAPSVANYVVPANDRVLVPNLRCFDVAFSMGVLYHCKHPIGHLEALRQALQPGGTLVLETLVIEGDVETALIPADRYAKMRNVWLIPSTLMLCRLLGRVGFRNVEVVDVTVTTDREQRTTDWMTFESLKDFMDPGDQQRTIEGHPGPRRAIVIAR